MSNTVNTAVRLATAAVAMAFGSLAVADENSVTKVIMASPPAFAEVDADGDSMVTEAEFEAFLDRRRTGRRLVTDPGDRTTAFDHADADGDGMLSREEFESMPRKVVRRQLHRGDPLDLFARGDVDHDGVLNEEEFEALMGGMRIVRRDGASSSEEDAQ